MSNYEDIIHLQRPASAKHPPMPRADRAKQFMPFAALKGYEAGIEAAQTTYDRLSPLPEEERQQLDQQLLQLQSAARSGAVPLVSLTWFEQAEGAASGMGHLRTRTGRVTKVTPDGQELVIDGQRIATRLIVALTEERGE